MTNATAQQDPRKIRIGLVVIGIVFVISVVLFFVIDDTLGQAIFFALAVLAIARAVLLVRWLRRQGASNT